MFRIDQQLYIMRSASVMPRLRNLDLLDDNKEPREPANRFEENEDLTYCQNAIFKLALSHVIICSNGGCSHLYHCVMREK